MAVGRKTGGRQKGTMNKRTQTLLEVIDSRYNGFSPILDMIKMYKKNDTPLDLKFAILKEITPYMHPKLKATIDYTDQIDKIREDALNEGAEMAAKAMFDYMNLATIVDGIKTIEELKESFKKMHKLRLESEKKTMP